MSRRTLWLLFAGFIVYGSLLPFHFSGSWDAVADRLRAIPANPFISPETGRRLSLSDFLQNVLLYLPFGVLGFLALERQERHWRRAATVVAAGFALSVVVEALQLLTVDRTASPGDVMADTLGTFAGTLLTWHLWGAAKSAVNRLRVEGLLGDGWRPSAIATILLAIAFWQPFDVTLDVGAIARKLRWLNGDLWQINGSRTGGTVVLLGAFFGMTCASYLSVVGERNAGRRAAAIGIGLVFLLEGSQLFVESHMPGLWHAVLGGAGVLAGTAIWSVAGRIIWPRFWLGVVVTATAAAAAAQSLSPFVFARHHGTVTWLPPAGDSHTAIDALSDAIELLLLYFPLGFWLGQAKGPHRRSLAAAVLLALVIAGPIEYLEEWTAGGHPNVAAVAISLLGAWIGAKAGLTKT